ncbi:VCBS repeat-containing protein [Cyanosarcina cf. burmensis CCALA 770]|nr:VCBS repeat-containing protein [Cyanosarcina cf. burmensis CCALA 770]
MKKYKKINSPLLKSLNLRNLFLIPISLALIIASVIAPKATGSDVTKTRDFNGDGKEDILWRNSSCGINNSPTAICEKVVWLMNGINLAGDAGLPGAEKAWNIRGIADFNGDRKPDILWKKDGTNEYAIWLINGNNIIAGEVVSTVNLPWDQSSIGDFNGDGKADLLWRNINTGENILWLMDGTKVIAGFNVPPVSDTLWSISSSPDFNGDGRADILWRKNNETVIWLMNGNNLAEPASLPAQFGVARTGDFNGDGKADILWRDNATGNNRLWLMNGTRRIADLNVPSVPNPPWDIASIADFDGNGRADIVWRTAAGDNYMWLMDSNNIIAEAFLLNVPSSWSIFLQDQH